MPDTIDVSPAMAQIRPRPRDCGSRTSRSHGTRSRMRLKDPDGNWVGAYYGIIALGTNTTIVKNAPKTFADLKKPEYKGQVGAQRRSPEGRRGLRRRDGRVAGQRWQLRRHHAGHPVLRRPEEARATSSRPTSPSQTILSGETPIALDWSYNCARSAAEADGRRASRARRIFPSDGVYGCYYAQGVVKDSPHPNCREAVDRAHPLRRGRARLPEGWSDAGPLRRRSSRPARSPPRT